MSQSIPNKPPPNIFHDHLDVCKQCHDHPMELCPVGTQVLRLAVESIEVSWGPGFKKERKL